MDLIHKPVITGQNLTLRPFKEDDLQAIKISLQDQEVIRLTGSSGEFDEEKVNQWYLTRNSQADRIDLAIVDHETQSVVGEVVVNELDFSSNSMNFRILIGQKGRNKGLGTEALSLITKYLFEEIKLDKITLSVFLFNPRALHLYKKAGFTEEYIERTELNHGEFADEVFMSLSIEQWKQSH
ncbi:GNAT family N-acetyltransferase [Jeotgalibacillus sp. R-1-5s-1]|uniref:GNAT family N-acetyltransferase n=1 Tax=Jeotgalibacillus sp. R-1-5s-1 TaxID=2555897 RepID=UPI00106BBC2E|nr:GNAT family protein [Jeotgalibacillus sp. R-1-5s-1]TFD94497.1 N-acetyltransferase [Jeotgalibacillus sp. R-1-5s-1]